MKKCFVFFLIMLMIVPVSVSAKTLAEFQAEVDKYTNELKTKKNAVAKNDSEVAEIKKKIEVLQSEISKLKGEVNSLQAEVDKSNEEVKNKTEESKKLMEYYQLADSSNAYLEYAFGADSITDMVYRVSIVEQLTDYNDKLMSDLKEIVAENEKQKKSLEKKQSEIKVKEVSLNEEKEKIEEDTKSIEETMPGVEQQIKEAQANVEYYKKLGCGKNEDISKCQFRVEQSKQKVQEVAVVPRNSNNNNNNSNSNSNNNSGNSSGGSSNNNSSGGNSNASESSTGFYRPIEYGYITQGYGGTGGHMGVDIGSSNKSIPIYAIANGVVFFKGYDTYGALVVKIRHNVGGRYIYSTYAHMSIFGNISVGQAVNPNTWIGNMGSTGWSTGPHLHLEITSCDWNRGGGCTWSQYQRSTISPYSYISLPSRWSNR